MTENQKMDLAWKQHVLLTDLIKFYFDLAVKLLALNAIVSGGTIAFYFSGDDQSLVLAIPIITNVGVIWMVRKGLPLVDHIGKGFEDRKSYALPVTIPDISTLKIFLVIGALVSAVVLVGITIQLSKMTCN